MTAKELQDEITAAVALQEKANAAVMAALQDETLMAGLLEARAEAERGERGELLVDVWKRLRLV